MTHSCWRTLPRLTRLPRCKPLQGLAASKGQDQRGGSWGFGACGNEGAFITSEEAPGCEGRGGGPGVSGARARGRGTTYRRCRARSHHRPEWQAAQGRPRQGARPCAGGRARDVVAVAGESAERANDGRRSCDGQRGRASGPARRVARAPGFGSRGRGVFGVVGARAAGHAACRDVPCLPCAGDGTGPVPNGV